jgi:hydroxymethylbilane synthase
MRLGTRGSALALAQARQVAELLRPHASHVEIVTITTSGDRESDATATSSSVSHGQATRVASDKSRWVLQLEQALSAGEIDLAVHSAKDVPSELGEGLALIGAPARSAVEDVLCGEGSIEELAYRARVGTSSLRRAAQLLSLRPDLRIEALGGNVDTRLRKLNERAIDAIVIARAGLLRLERDAEVDFLLDPERFVPSPGQGTLALEGRLEDDLTQATVAAITHKDTLACLLAERALARALGASCHTPLGAWAKPAGCGCLELRAWVGLPNGSSWVADELVGGFYEPEELGLRVAERLTAAGGGELLRRAEEMGLEGA